mgnify:CR=1 FL=1
MKQFDYARAWAEVARSKYDSLPADVRQLFIDTAWITKDLRQLPDCSMPWPDADMEGSYNGRELRGRFDKIPAEWLALASCVIHDFGHWRPTGVSLPPAEDQAIRQGGHWHFSHYADQSLRGRLGLAESGDR